VSEFSGVAPSGPKRRGGNGGEVHLDPVAARKVAVLRAGRATEPPTLDVAN
jgi:hypothetical protein